MTLKAAHDFLERAERSQALKRLLDRVKNERSYKATVRHYANRWGLEFTNHEYQQALRERYGALSPADGDGSGLLDPAKANTSATTAIVDALADTYGKTFFPRSLW